MAVSVKARHRPVRWLTAPLLILALSAAACGGDGSGDKGKSDQASASTKQYCANSLAIETAPQPQVDFGTLSPEQQAEEAKKFAIKTIRPLADRLIGSAPDQIKDKAQVFNGALAEVEKTGDFETVYNRPGVVDAFNSLHSYDLENCDWGRVNVVATDYKFDGVPATVPAGVTSFEFDNNGTEQHEMVIFRRNDGETMTFDQILTIQDQAEAEKHMKLVEATGGNPNDPENLYAVADVEPGDYIMVCFIPVGSTPEAVKAAHDANKEVEGPPHFTQGMKAEFKVAA